LVEHSLGARKPDITLLRGGRPIGAIEVFATHRVDDQKAADLSALGVPWLEVRAEPEIISLEKPWTLPSALTCLRQGVEQPWLCRRCETPVAETSAPPYTRERVVGYNCIDRYFQNGDRDRLTFLVIEKHVDDLVVGRVLRHVDASIRPIAQASAPITEQKRKRLDEAFKAELRRLSLHTSTVLRHGWRRGYPQGVKKVAFSLRWDEERKRWY